MANEDNGLDPLYKGSGDKTPVIDDSGLVEPGNINVHQRPIVYHKDGSYSTLYSMSFNTPKGEVLVPQVSDDGRMLSEKEAKDNYYKTGKHLGIFKTPEAADKQAEWLHTQGAKEYAPYIAKHLNRAPMPDQDQNYTTAEPTPLANFVRGQKGIPTKNPYAPFSSEDQLMSTAPEDISPADTGEVKPEAAVQERNPESFEREYPAAPVTPQPGSGISAAYARQIPADFEQEAAAAQEEKGARASYAQDVGEAMSGEEEQLRGDALVRQAQAQETQQTELGAIDEIHHLVRDYADGHIDQDQWWTEKSVPQKIGAVIGAMAAGLGGGVRGAMSYVNGMIDRNVARQQEEIHRKGAAAGEATNLLYSFMKSSQNAQEAFDKTRAAMLQASMVEVQRAATIAQSPIEAAKIDELLAALQTQRDMAMAKLAAASGVGMGESGLQLDPKTIYTDPDTMLTYKVDNPEAMGQMIQTLDAYKKIKDGLRAGDVLLAARDELSWKDSKPWADSLQQGEALDGAIMEAASKLAMGRGVPTGVKEMVTKLKPEFGSRFGYLDRAKIPKMIQMLDQYKDNILKAHGARQAAVQYGPGRGKHAGEMVPYATLGSRYQGQPQPQSSEAPKTQLDFRPSGQ